MAVLNLIPLPPPPHAWMMAISREPRAAEPRWYVMVRPMLRLRLWLSLVLSRAKYHVAMHPASTISSQARINCTPHRPPKIWYHHYSGDGPRLANYRLHYASMNESRRGDPREKKVGEKRTIFLPGVLRVFAGSTSPQTRNRTIWVYWPGFSKRTWCVELVGYGVPAVARYMNTASQYANKRRRKK